MSFDRRRGVHIRRHPTGFNIGMYVDEPGVYYDERGVKIADPKLAKAAGFSVEQDTRARELAARKAKAIQAVEAEFASAEQRLMRAAENGGEGLSIAEVGVGRYALVDEDGNKLTAAQPLTWDEAVLMYEGISGKQFVREADNPPDLSGAMPGPPPTGTLPKAKGTGTKKATPQPEPSLDVPPVPPAPDAAV